MLLESPIDDVVAPAVPVNAAAMTAEDIAFVDELTAPLRFSYEFWETENGETVLKLVAPTDQ